MKEEVNKKVSELYDLICELHTAVTRLTEEERQTARDNNSFSLSIAEALLQDIQATIKT
jgi:hypothetical protein